jgi:DnaK suppressor protein
VKPEELERMSALLEEMRDKLRASARAAAGGDVHLDPDTFPDEIDSASSESGLAFVGRLRERERSMLRKIEAALGRIRAGSFGICLECGDPISLPRLQARPVATLCIDCKAEQESAERD